MNTLDAKLVDKLPELLREAVVEIGFFKVDGTLRVMLATLKPELLPERTVEDFSEIPAKVSSVQVVYDTETKAFRSYRKDQVAYFKISSENNKATE